jgi:hypothetical protein
MKKAASIALVLFALSVIAGAQTPLVDDPEAYAVYNAVIAKQWPVNADEARKLVIAVETEDYPRFGRKGVSVCNRPAPDQEATLRPLINAYVDANKNKLSFQRKFELPYEYQLVPRGSITAMFKADDLEKAWKNFYVTYPGSGGFIQLSAVGFNADKTLALVYTAHSCGSLCGSGGYHLMKKTDGKWSEIAWPGDTCTWVS